MTSDFICQVKVEHYFLFLFLARGGLQKATAVVCMSNVSTSLEHLYDISSLGQFTVICEMLTTCQKRHNRELGVYIER